MSRRPFKPDLFTVGMMALGLVLLVFPAMRVASLVALIASVAYWLVMGALRSR
jgi:hypothetical protein